MVRFMFWMSNKIKYPKPPMDIIKIPYNIKKDIKLFSWGGNHNSVFEYFSTAQEENLAAFSQFFQVSIFVKPCHPKPKMLVYGLSTWNNFKQTWIIICRFSLLQKYVSAFQSNIENSSVTVFNVAVHCMTYRDTN